MSRPASDHRARVVGLCSVAALAPLALAAACVALALPAAASAGSLPTVSSGARPGPPILYKPPAKVPELSVKRPFRAKPLLVSGTDAYRRGEYVYQDYLFDDGGASTAPGSLGLGSSSGDVRYPTAESLAGNAADLVELRIKPTRRALVYRVTLNTVKAIGAAIVGIGIDTDAGGGEPVAWPNGAGISSPGLDRFITAWGTGGEVTELPDGSSRALPKGAVQISPRTNQMTIRVPRRLMDPSRDTWRYVAGVGLHDGHGGFTEVPSGAEPTEQQPASGSPLRAAPGVFNLAFRFDEPQGLLGPPNHDTIAGYGVWFEAEQARVLAEASSGGFFAEVDFGALAGGASGWRHAPGQTQARIHTSRLELAEGRIGGDDFGGRLQPYLLRVPPGYDREQPAALTLALHGNGATYTQYAVFSPNYLRQIGDERQAFVLTPLERTRTSDWPETDADIFEAWADVAHRFALDPDRVALSGYSRGGYNTFRLGVLYPDLFGKAFPIVGAARLLGGGVPGDETNFIPMLASLRWVPYIHWAQLTDEIAPWLGARLTHDRLNALGLRNELWSFAVGEHFTPGLLDQWRAAADWLGDARVTRDPSRVDYGIAPAAWGWSPEHGLVPDHAYWVSELRLRDESSSDETGTARGYIAAISGAFGEGDPATRPVVFAHPGRPGPATIDGTKWIETRQTEAQNALELRLRNLRRGTIDGKRAELRGRRPLTVSITSDGPARVRLVLPFPRGVSVTAAGEAPSSADVSVNRRVARFRVEAGTKRYQLTP